MLLDGKLEFSDAQAVTATAASTNQVDLGASPPDLGGGVNLFAIAEVGVDFATLTSLQVSLQDSADNSTYADIVASPVVLLAALVSGKRMLIAPIPQNHRRYLRMNWTVGGSSATAGSVNAYIVTQPQTNR